MLRDILTLIALEKGETSANKDRNARILSINKAAQEVHEMYDLEEGKDEKVFSLSVDDSPQIALPSYVFQVRGMRMHDGRQFVTVDDARNRFNFHEFAENDLWYLKYRRKRQSALSRDIQNQSVLKFSFPLAESGAVAITVNGATDNSYRTSETLIFSPGELSKETVGNYTAIDSIIKDIITKYNVTIKDVEDNIVGTILNSEYQSQYSIYQIGDTEGFTLPETSSAVEVWFKYKLQPFKNDTDSFLGTDRYDKAIVWKWLEHQAKEIDEALAFSEKCGQAIAATLENTDAGTRKQINFKPQALLDIYGYGYQG